MEFDFVLILWILFALIYITRVVIVNKFIINNIKPRKDVDHWKVVFYIHSIPRSNHYNKNVNFYIQIVNTLSRLIILMMIVNFLVIFLQNLIRDMG